jgi:hypothetical protein
MAASHACLAALAETEAAAQSKHRKSQRRGKCRQEALEVDSESAGSLDLGALMQLFAVDERAVQVPGDRTKRSHQRVQCD